MTTFDADSQARIRFQGVKWKVTCRKLIGRHNLPGPKHYRADPIRGFDMESGFLENPKSKIIVKNPLFFYLKSLKKKEETKIQYRFPFNAIHFHISTPIELWRLPPSIQLNSGLSPPISPPARSQLSAFLPRPAGSILARELGLCSLELPSPSSRRRWLEPPWSESELGGGNYCFLKFLEEFVDFFVFVLKDWQCQSVLCWNNCWFTVVFLHSIMCIRMHIFV